MLLVSRREWQFSLEISQFRAAYTVAEQLDLNGNE